MPDCVRAFLGFLDERGSLTGEPLDHALDQLRDEFHQRARDRTHWGLAKSMVMQMQAEGLDPGAPGALETWIADFNARPPEQHDQIIGPAGDRMAHAAGLRPTAGTPAPKQRAAKRRSSAPTVAASGRSSARGNTNSASPPSSTNRTPALLFRC